VVGSALIITHWGGPSARALELLKRMRGEDVRCPVVVFCTDYDADTRKRQALALGAQALCFRWESLFTAIQRVLRPGRETG